LGFNQEPAGLCRYLRAGIGAVEGAGPWNEQSRGRSRAEQSTIAGELGGHGRGSLERHRHGGAWVSWVPRRSRPVAALLLPHPAFKSKRRFGLSSDDIRARCKARCWTGAGNPMQNLLPFLHASCSSGDGTLNLGKPLNALLARLSFLVSRPPVSTSNCPSFCFRIGAAATGRASSTALWGLDVDRFTIVDESHRLFCALFMPALARHGS
jgi:hypothetical protein